jgi:hypothetical protein
MEAKRLIPYSVHLREDIYIALKLAARERKATSMVRDAITMIIEGTGPFESGYKKGLRDAISAVEADEDIKKIAFGGRPISENLLIQLEMMCEKA